MNTNRNKTMNEVVDIWNAERILHSFLRYSDANGYLPKVNDVGKSVERVKVQRFYAALRAYNKKPDWFFKESNNAYDPLISLSRSRKKMNEFRELLKHELISGEIKHFVESLDFTDKTTELGIVFNRLMKYRKHIFALENITSDGWKYNNSVLAVYEALNDMNQKYIAPLSKVIDRMLILLMGDVYDREFTAEELIPYGYPIVSAEELKKMEKDDELPF